MLRLPTLSVLILPFSSRTRTPMASLFATPESFKDSAAVSAAASLLKIPKTTVLFDIYVPILSCIGQAHSRAEQEVRAPNVHVSTAHNALKPGPWRPAEGVISRWSGSPGMGHG